MASDMIAELHDRGAIAVRGADAHKLLQGLITNDMDALQSAGSAIYAALLSPQGKILFDFFVVRTADGYLLDVARDQAAALVKRLTMYKLRAAAELQDISDSVSLTAHWGTEAKVPDAGDAWVQFTDPRHAMLGVRVVSRQHGAASPDARSPDAYTVHRLALGVPEGGRDFAFGDTYPHEACFDLYHGVSFTKGCYVGQEVVARMQNKSVVRKRVVKVAGSAPLTAGADLLLGETPVGRIGSVNGVNALAMVRLDRALEARDKGIVLRAAGVAVKINEHALDHYRSAVAARPAAPDMP